MSVVAVVQFPGSNDDHDAHWALKALGADARLVWHADTELPRRTGAVVLPGGFSYGDYLRCGAIARFAPIMDEVRGFAEAGGAVVGICNGFQILCEAGLLPGALIRNRQLRFVCRWVDVRVETSVSPLSAGLVAGEVLRVPVKHGEGQFVASAADLDRIERDGLVVFRYCSPDGAIGEPHTPNGASNAIAGLCNDAGNVVGLMPHPEHAVEDLTGPGTDGLALFTSALATLTSA